MKWFNLSTSYGFIITDEINVDCRRLDRYGSCKDVFFHINNVHSEKEHMLGKGDRVTLIFDKDGPCYVGGD